MIQEEFKTVMLRAEEGKYLTQKDEVNILDRIISPVIALGKHDSIDNYIEIDAQTADDYRKQKEEADASDD